MVELARRAVVPLPPRGPRFVASLSLGLGTGVLLSCAFARG